MRPGATNRAGAANACGATRGSGLRRGRLSGVILRRQKLPRYDAAWPPHLSSNLATLTPRHARSCVRCRADTDALGETIAALAARLHAATYELLVLLREFDERTGWNNGFLSCAHWLHWRTGIDLGAAREKVRVAKALPALPRISAAMQRGQISYAKVRALTRVATPRTKRRSSTWRWPATARTSNGSCARGGAWTACRRRGDGGEAPAAPALHLGGRRRHGRDSRTAHARGRRRGAARARGRGRPVVPRDGARADRRRDGRGADAGPASRRRARRCWPSPPWRPTSMAAPRATAIRWCCT